MTWLTVALSASAFVVASAALYLAMARRADIRLAYGGSSSRWCEGPELVGDVLRVPQPLDVAFVAANVGAREGVLESVELVNLVHEGAEPPLWTTVEARGEALPRALDAGSLASVRVLGELRGSPPTSAEASAERVRGLTSLRVTLRWTFVRAPGRFGVVLQRSGKRVTRRRVLTLDCGLYRDEVLAHWRGRESWHLLAIAERRATMLANIARSPTSRSL